MKAFGIRCLILVLFTLGLNSTLCAAGVTLADSFFNITIISDTTVWTRLNSNSPTGKTSQSIDIVNYTTDKVNSFGSGNTLVKLNYLSTYKEFRGGSLILEKPPQTQSLIFSVYGDQLEQFISALDFIVSTGRFNYLDPEDNIYTEVTLGGTDVDYNIDRLMHYFTQNGFSLATEQELFEYNKNQTLKDKAFLLLLAENLIPASRFSTLKNEMITQNPNLSSEALTDLVLMTYLRLEGFYLAPLNDLAFEQNLLELFSSLSPRRYINLYSDLISGLSVTATDDGKLYAEPTASIEFSLFRDFKIENSVLENEIKNYVDHFLSDLKNAGIKDVFLSKPLFTQFGSIAKSIRVVVYIPQSDLLPQSLFKYLQKLPQPTSYQLEKQRLDLGLKGTADQCSAFLN